VALGGVIGALSLICMLGTVFPYAIYAMPALAGIMLIPVVAEIGVRWAWLVFGSVAALSLMIILSYSPEATAMYVAFLGYYPVLRVTLQKLPFFIAWPLKLLVFNAAVISVYWALMNLAAIPPDAFEMFGVDLPQVMLVFGNVVFIIYDLALENIYLLYIKYLHPQIKRLFH